MWTCTSSVEEHAASIFTSLFYHPLVCSINCKYVAGQQMWLSEMPFYCYTKVAAVFLHTNYISGGW